MERNMFNPYLSDRSPMVIGGMSNTFTGSLIQPDTVGILSKLHGESINGLQETVHCGITNTEEALCSTNVPLGNPENIYDGETSLSGIQGAQRSIYLRSDVNYRGTRYLIGL